MTIAFRMALAAVLVGIAACGGAKAPNAAATMTQSGSALVGDTHVVDGVTTIDFPADAFERAAKFVVDTVPVAVMGGPGVDPEYDLTLAHDATILPGNRNAMVVAMNGIAHLLVFDSAGKPLHSFGKLGEGPGEFMRPDRAFVLGGDTLLIPDDGNNRLNYFSPDKGYLTSVSMARDSTRRVMPILMPVGHLAGDRMVWYSPVWGGGDTTKRTRTVTPVAVSGMKVERIRLIDSAAGVELVPILTRYRNHPRMSTTPLRFGRMATAATWDSTVVVADGSRGYSVDEYSPDGHVVRRITVHISRRPVTRAMRDAQIAVELARICPTCGEGMVDPDETRRQARENPFADSLPPYGGVWSGGGNTLWIVDASAPSDSAWDATAFRRDGAIIGRLHMPIKSGPVAFGTDRVVVRAVNDDGIVSFKVYRFTAPQ